MSGSPLNLYLMLFNLSAIVKAAKTNILKRNTDAADDPYTANAINEPSSVIMDSDSFVRHILRGGFTLCTNGQ